MILQEALNTIAMEAFRDQADMDYISARQVYRLQLREQFFWLSLQAIEKFLKAILLFNNRSSIYKNWPSTNGPKFNHDISALYRAVEIIADLNFTCPTDVRDFIDFVNRLGPNRYFDHSTYTFGDELSRLDLTVWHIRRFCQYLHFDVPDRSGGKRDIITEHTAWLNSTLVLLNPKLVSLPKGFLEQVLIRPPSNLARRALIWHNRYYYGLRKRIPVNDQSMQGSANPPNVRQWMQDPSLRSQIIKYVKLP